MGIRGVWGGVKGEYGCNVAPPHGILTKKMVLPPTIVSGWMISIQQGGWGGMECLSFSPGVSCKFGPIHVAVGICLGSCLKRAHLP